MQLVIETTQKGVLILEFRDRQGQIVRRIRRVTQRLSEEILLVLREFLKKNNVVLNDLTKIFVNPGPGAFSSTRIGVATANALSYALGIPVAEWPSGKIKEMILPKYEKEPNITRPQKRH